MKITSPVLLTLHLRERTGKMKGRCEKSTPCFLSLRKTSSVLIEKNWVPLC
jgi:hypothetical protein